MAARKIGALLGAPELNPLSRKAHRLTALQARVLYCVPPPLARGVRVADYRAGTLFLTADNGALAAKLKQLAPSLLLNIRKLEPEVTGIKIAVQVKEVTPALRAAGPVSRGGIPNIEAFRALARTLPESALKTAVMALVRRHAGAKRSGDQ